MEFKQAEIFLPDDQVEELVLEYLEEMDSHPAFNLSDVRVMPDTHPEPNSRTIIGFTMPFNGIVIPNIVGNDIGCGVSGVSLGEDIDLGEQDFEKIDTTVRSRVPMGRGRNGYSAPDRPYINLKDEFDWAEATARLANFVEDNGLEGTMLDGFEYNIEFFKSLCKRVEYGQTDGINAVGTLGAGNHFIEVCNSSDTGEYWIVAHSGSRGLGKTVADYWQQKAARYRSASEVRNSLPTEYAAYLKFDLESVSDSDLLEWVTGGKGEDFVDYDTLKAEYAETENAHRIEEIKQELKSAVPEDGIRHPWDYLENEEAYGYYRDMVFCQMYASLNRAVMLETVAEVLEVDINRSDILDSPHNVVDFKDSVIRKGATRVHENEEAIIPFNMRDGGVIVEGRGNENWNRSCPHGAGRVGSRGEARDEISEAEAKAEMKDVFSSEIPLDEAPQAYKQPGLIQERMTETVTITDTLEPVINFKAPSRT